MDLATIDKLNAENADLKKQVSALSDQFVELRLELKEKQSFLNREIHAPTEGALQQLLSKPESEMLVSSLPIECVLLLSFDKILKHLYLRSSL